MQRYLQAAAHLNLALKHQYRPEVVTIVSLGRCYQELGKHELALEHYDSALRSDGPKAYAFFCRGHCRRLLGDEAGSAADFSQCIKADSKFHVSYMQRAEECVRRQDFVGADDILSSILKHLPLPHDERYKVEERRKFVRQRSPRGQKFHS
jgi:tetratricopeptide (TPR) repeat protein